MMAVEWAVRLKVPVLSVDYRLLPEHKVEQAVGTLRLRCVVHNVVHDVVKCLLACL